jgi:hypothetical protein
MDIYEFSLSIQFEWFNICRSHLKIKILVQNQGGAEF